MFNIQRNRQLYAVDACFVLDVERVVVVIEQLKALPDVGKTYTAFLLVGLFSNRVATGEVQLLGDGCWVL